jgi:hypothetical protein
VHTTVETFEIAQPAAFLAQMGGILSEAGFLSRFFLRRRWLRCTLSEHGLWKSVSAVAAKSVKMHAFVFNASLLPA